MWYEVFTAQFTRLRQIFPTESPRVTEYDLNLIKALGKPAPDETRWKKKVQMLFYPCPGDVPTTQIPVNVAWFENDHIYQK